MQKLKKWFINLSIQRKLLYCTVGISLILILSASLSLYIAAARIVTTQTRKQSTGVIEELSVNLDHYFQLVEMETTNKDIEFQALQAQINPHFLYNVLDTINWMARKKGEEKNLPDCFWHHSDKTRCMRASSFLISSLRISRIKISFL